MTKCPLDYSLCRQTVTVYRNIGGSIERSVLTNCAFSRQQEQVVDTNGTRQSTGFLLIVPGPVQQVFSGDRVLEGEGPVIDPDGWSTFLPVTVPGLCQVSYVRVCYWEDGICHIEAGHRNTARQQL